VKITVLGGWAYPSSSLNGLAEAISPGADARIISFDQPLEDVDPTPDLLIGWSLGGLRAIEAVAKGAIRPHRLALVSSTARFCATEDYIGGTDRAALRSMMVGLRRNRAATLTAFFTGAMAPTLPDTAMIEEREQDARIFSDAALAHGLSLLDTMDMRPHAAQLTIPVLILHGARDRIIPASAAKYLATAVRQATVRIHPDAGHELVLREQPWVVEQLRGHTN
jgi:pimeloyl-[acyl-carrier protein] methyl ester esterase